MHIAASKWWFNLSSLCDDRMKAHNGNIKEFVCAMQHFIETSTLGDFTVKIHMILNIAHKLKEESGNINVFNCHRYSIC